MLKSILVVAACLAEPVAGQAADSLAVARRVVAAASLAAKEYANGVTATGGEIVQPEEVAEAILYLLSNAASYVTGANLRVSGAR